MIMTALRVWSLLTQVEIRSQFDTIQVFNATPAQGVRDDMYQAPFFAKPGDWQTLRLPFEQFTLTWRGSVEEHLIPLKTNQIARFGILVAAQEGPFDFGMFTTLSPEIARIQMYTQKAVQREKRYTL